MPPNRAPALDFINRPAFPKPRTVTIQQTNRPYTVLLQVFQLIVIHLGGYWTAPDSRMVYTLFDSLCIAKGCPQRQEAFQKDR